MIDAPRLLGDLTSLTKVLETDLRQRCEATPTVDAPLRAEYEVARAAGRTADTYTEWREDRITQSAVHWVLGCVFVRFLEDNHFVAHQRDGEGPFLSGPGDRLALARDRKTVYFQQHPSETDREYLLDVFQQLAALPSAGPLFDPRTNPLFSLALSGDGAGALLAFWQKVDPQTGALIHDFSSSDRDTRFLGDLYQDLSEAARSHYALLQTPEFVEEFILERTLVPAIEEFGWREVRLLDPTCGSGHFLLGAFRRLLALWEKHEPGTNERTRVQLALNAVAGVDLNPFAIAIARFRLLIAALTASHIERLKDAPRFEIHLATGDSLLHGTRFRVRSRETASMAGQQIPFDPGQDKLRHVYATEDREALRAILGRQYHAVVGNPPYIVVRDAALNQAYRNEYGSCSGKYSLGVPFTERFFELALGAGSDGRAGYIGMITTNSFMKREFGKKLIEKFVPSWDLTHVLDMAGAYIPGHGTPTVILFGRNRLPEQKTVRAVMGIRGEPSTPEDPAKGLVWSAVVGQVDLPGSVGEFVSVADVERGRFHSHPWSLGGGGAAELKELIEGRAASVLGERVASIGVAAVTLADDAFGLDVSSVSRRLLLAESRPLVDGDNVRDWDIQAPVVGLFAYDSTGTTALPSERLCAALWPLRRSLETRLWFRKTQAERGLHWAEYGFLSRDKLSAQLLIGFAFVATHNHFVLDRGGKVFKQTAPVIKLPAGATEDDHLALLGLLNSSTSCFWLKQVCQSRGDSTDNQGARVSGADLWVNSYEIPAGLLQDLPVPSSMPLQRARALDQITGSRHQHLPDAWLQTATLLPPVTPAPFGQRRTAQPPATAPAPRPGPSSPEPETRLPEEPRIAAANRSSDTVDPSPPALGGDIRRVSQLAARLLASAVALQEELDWECYHHYGLLDEDLTLPAERVPGIALGERAFEIVLARRLAAGEVKTAWFVRHGSTPITEIPAHWPEEYRRLVARRIEVIEADPNIRLIEQPEHKRRWNLESWDDQQARALRGWLLDRLESPAYWPATELQTVARLADRAREDADFHEVAEVYRGRADFDVTSLVHELCTSEAVPFLPVLRYSEPGLRKRGEWERTWEMQRAEDAIDARTKLPESDPNHLTEGQAKARKASEVGDIAVPPKYAQADFRRPEYWRLRGKLDVPKERFISFPGGERAGDPTPLLGWAGWDHLQVAQALASFYVRMRDEEAWPDDRLAPLLAGLQDLLPWLHQWHSAFDPTWQMSLSTYFQNFVTEETRARGFTPEGLKNWQPPAGVGPKRGRKKKST